MTDKLQQSGYINMFKENGLNAVILEHKIDQPFINRLEAKNEDIRFERIDSGVNASVKGELSEEEAKELTESLSTLFKKVLGKENLEVKAESFKNEEISAVITVSEETRRMQEMMRMYSMGAMEGEDPFAGGETLVLNTGNSLVKYLLSHKENTEDEKTVLICEQLYDLARISNKPLSAGDMTKFINRSNKVLKIITE